MLCSCRFRTVESTRPYGDVEYNTIEQDHNLPLQTLHKLQIVLERIEQSTDVEKRRFLHAGKDRGSEPSPSPHSCLAVEEKLDKVIEQMNTLLAANGSQTNGQGATPVNTDPVIVRVSTEGSFQEE